MTCSESLARELAREHLPFALRLVGDDDAGWVLARAVRTYDPARNQDFRPWLRLMARQELCHRALKVRRRNGLRLVSFVPEVRGASPSGPDPFDGEAFDWLVAILPPRDRDLILAVYRDGLTLVDYARDRGFHKSTVVSRHAAVLDRLRPWAEALVG